MDVAFASYLIRYQLNSDEVLPEWAHFALEAPAIRAELESLAASSAGQHNLGLNKLDRLQLPCPDLSVQEDALARIRKLEDDRLRIVEAIAYQSCRVEKLHRALLAAAFSGKLTGRHTDQEVIGELAGV